MTTEQELTQTQARLAALESEIAAERAKLAKLAELRKPADTNRPDLLTPKQVAEFLNMPLPTVYYLIKSAKMAACRIAGRWRVRRSTLEEMTQPKFHTPEPVAAE